MATLINGNGNLAIYAQQDADWYAALMGGQTVITAVGNQFAYELLAANTIGVKDGVIITSEGRRIQLDANAIDSFDIPTGAQGTTNYYIIGYHLVTGDQSEQTCETFVQLMENGSDTIPEGSFRAGDDEVYVSLYRVEQDDLTIGTITLLLPQLSESLQNQINGISNDLPNELSVDGQTLNLMHDDITISSVTLPSSSAVKHSKTGSVNINVATSATVNLGFTPNASKTLVIHTDEITNGSSGWVTVTFTISGSTLIFNTSGYGVGTIQYQVIEFN